MPKLSRNKCIFCQEEKTDKLKTIMILEGSSKKLFILLNIRKYYQGEKPDKLKTIMILEGTSKKIICTSKYQ